MGIRAPQSSIGPLAASLELEEVGPLRFRGFPPEVHRDRERLFGGQIASQALRAAGLTVPSDRLAHSFHSYFVRVGRVDAPVEFLVEAVRDGGSFSLRHVSARQDGEPIFLMTASFQREPNDLANMDELPLLQPLPDRSGPDPSRDELIEMHEVTPTRTAPSAKNLYPDLLWVRSREKLRDDPLLHACAVTYFTDLGSGFGQIEDSTIGVGGPSLDHSVWFHHPARADEWMLLALEPTKALGDRGVYQGSLRDEDGKLIAMVTQECLLRPDALPRYLTPEA